MLRRGKEARLNRGVNAKGAEDNLGLDGWHSTSGMELVDYRRQTDTRKDIERWWCGRAKSVEDLREGMQYE
jgi:hypothetical protein